MNAEHDLDDDLLIAEYTLGLLDLQETAQAHALLGKDQQAVVAALAWENRFLDLVDCLPPIEPPAQLLQRIQASLGMEITLIKRPSIWPRIIKKIVGVTWGGLWFWRVLSVVLFAVAITYAAKPNLAVIDAAPLAQVAVLQAPGQTSTPGWVLSLDEKRNLQLTPRVHIDVPPDASVELWTRSTSAPQPRSLGVIDPNKATSIPASALGEISLNQLFEMTLENKGGSETNSPEGPILFIGRMIVLTQQAVPSPS